MSTKVVSLIAIEKVGAVDGGPIPRAFEVANSEWICVADEQESGIWLMGPSFCCELGWPSLCSSTICRLLHFTFDEVSIFGWPRSEWSVSLDEKELCRFRWEHFEEFGDEKFFAALTECFKICRK